MPKDPNEVGALWNKQSNKGVSYMSGTIKGQRVVCFKNLDKKSDKHPDWRVIVSQPQEKKESF